MSGVGSSRPWGVAPSNPIDLPALRCLACLRWIAYNCRRLASRGACLLGPKAGRIQIPTGLIRGVWQRLDLLSQLSSAIFPTQLLAHKHVDTISNPHLLAV